MVRILFVMILGISSNSVAATSACSIENSQKLLNLAAKVIGEMGSDDVKMTKMILDEKITDVKEIRKKVMEIKKNSKAGNTSKEVGAFAEAHPECDPEGNFRITHPHK
ncbi:hypothetical protein [Bdellovibrio svalbardensis]|uniref:Uncharacterized protein n=1 Tax=Bdellovibrio svalbardensis TaxID=2972972 RepID=A0ABT6DLS6_9BACT|nr:hypothetical protein [Bdellovibrio svalbardensis]MDG0817827.1 hypothetical protein [Bdellovibrio svalbardensis]